MRIPFPERIPIEGAALFCAALFVVQQLEGTALYFSMGCVLFVLIATFAFNTAGGLTRASGAYVFFYSVLVVIVGLIYKAYLGEPADSNLHDPHTTIKVYVGGITAMLAAVVVSRRISRRTGLLQNVMKDSDMYRASIGCMVIGIGGPFLIALLGPSGAWLRTAFTQLNELVPLAIIIGVMYEIRRSGGTRSLNISILLAQVYFFIVIGVVAFSKQGMLTPLVCWLVPVCALRFRLSAMQVLSCLVAVFVIFQYLVPYAQYGRRFATDRQTISQRLAIAEELLEHPENTRQDFERESGGYAGYFNTQQGFWDRLQFISVDDSLIDLTDQGKVFGWSPITASFLNAVPHVFWPNKPELNFGNIYAHEMGGLSEGDSSTGISFSPTAEAYHMGRWKGVFVAAPLIWLLMFVLFDSLIGDLRATPWGLLLLVDISHAAPEGAINGVIYLITYGTEIFVFCAIFAAWVAPVFATFVVGPDRRRNARRISLRPARSPRIQTLSGAPTTVRNSTNRIPL